MYKERERINMNNDREDILMPDIETKRIWQKHLSREYILSSTKDNFWRMRDTIPCGPCTEINYDLTGINGSEMVNKDSETLIDI